MDFITFLRALPEIVKLIRSLVIQSEGRGDSKKIKKDLKDIAQAIEEGDEKKLNDIFISMQLQKPGANQTRD